MVKCIRALLFKPHNFNNTFYNLRFQASSFIAKFLGLCKLPRGEFTHVLEPLKCSLRHYVGEHNVLGASEMSEERQRVMKRVMVEVMRGLDYLHERGWVHFDLNMDSICVSD